MQEEFKKVIFRNDFQKKNLNFQRKKEKITIPKVKNVANGYCIYALKNIETH